MSKTVQYVSIRSETLLRRWGEVALHAINLPRLKTTGRSTNPAERPLFSPVTRHYATAAATDSDHALCRAFVPSTRIRIFRSRPAGRLFTVKVRRLL